VTTTDRDELIALYTATLARFRAAQSVLAVHGNGNSVPTRAELQAVVDARTRMLELRRVLWPGWMHS
jgi:hypothetical protein